MRKRSLKWEGNGIWGGIWAQNKRARHHVGPACLLQTLYLMKTSSEGGIVDQ